MVRPSTFQTSQPGGITVIDCFSEFFPENWEGQGNEEGRHWGPVIRIPMGRDVRGTKNIGGTFHAVSQSPQWDTVCCGLSGRLGVAYSNFFCRMLQLGVVMD